MTASVAVKIRVQTVDDSSGYSNQTYFNPTNDPPTNDTIAAARCIAIFGYVLHTSKVTQATISTVSSRECLTL